MGLGRNKWHFLSFVGTRLSANRAPSGPRTTPLALSEWTTLNIIMMFLGYRELRKNHFYMLCNITWLLYCSGWDNVCSGLGLLQAESIQSAHWYGCTTDLSNQSSKCKSAFGSCWQNRSRAMLQVQYDTTALIITCQLSCLFVIRLDWVEGLNVKWAVHSGCL